MNKRWGWIVQSIFLGLAGCGIFGSGSGSGSDVGDDGPNSTEFSACRGGASDEQVADTVRIVDEYGESLHEMVACGQLNVALCSGIIEGIIDAILAQSNDAMPPGWGYQGEGVYHTSGTNVVMDTRFYLTEDFSFGSAGDMVVDNLFIVDSYLIDALAVVDYSTGEVTIEHGGPGPLVELLGLGPTPPNPIPITLADISSLGDKLGALEFSADIVVDDPREVSTIQYRLSTSRMPAQALIDGSPMSYILDQADGFRDDLGQTLTVDDWSVTFVDEDGGALDGAIEFHVDGSHFPFAGVMTFMRSTFPERELTCQ